MKRTLSFVLVLLLVFFLPGCYSAEDLREARSDGYDDGYSEGYRDGRDVGYSKGYDAGIDDYSFSYSDDVIDEAEWYARDRSGLSVEEASYIISDILYGTSYWGSEPTSDDLYQALESLYAFYFYLY